MYKAATGLGYQSFLDDLHRENMFDWYMEIGCNEGRTFAPVQSKTVAVDPFFKCETNIIGKKPTLHVFQEESDSFFSSGFLNKMNIRLSFSFLDGMHKFDYLLRDFMNAEANAHRDGVIALHDCCPFNEEMTTVDMSNLPKGAWTGDVWKLLPILQEYRPDLKLTVLGCRPTGLVLISELDPKSTALAAAYDEIIQRYDGLELKQFGTDRFFNSFQYIDPKHYRDMGYRDFEKIRLNKILVTKPIELAPHVSFDSKNPLRHTVVEDAVVVSFFDGDQKKLHRQGGIFDTIGNYVPMGQCWRSTFVPVTIPTAKKFQAPVHQQLQGTWLFGGVIYGHFGHFLCESISRLWGLELDGFKFDGIIFHPETARTNLNHISKVTKPWFASVGCMLPTVFAVDPVLVERLVIPEQGFGLGQLVKGHPDFRDFMRRRLGASVSAFGPEKLYISRSKLDPSLARITGEDFLEKALEAEGYEVFHPQNHSIEDQIAAYKAAKFIISSDNSALHLAAFFAKPNDKIAIIVRRPGTTFTEYCRQYQGFGAAEPLVISHLKTFYTKVDGAQDLEDKRGIFSLLYADVDYPAIRQNLIDGGFIAGKPWVFPSEDDIRTELSHYFEGHEDRMVPLVL